MNALKKNLLALPLLGVLGAWMAVPVAQAAAPTTGRVAQAAKPVPMNADQVRDIQDRVAQTKAAMQAEGDFRPGTPESHVRWIDGFLEQRRSDWKRQGVNVAVANMLAFWLGEEVRAQTGGHWALVGQQPVLVLANGQLAHPHNKVLRRVQNGSADDLLQFYRVSLAVAKGEKISAPRSGP